MLIVLMWISFVIAGILASISMYFDGVFLQPPRFLSEKPPKEVRQQARALTWYRPVNVATLCFFYVGLALFGVSKFVFGQ